MSEPASGTLFDVSQTVPAVCEICKATRPAGADRTLDCQIDRERTDGDYRGTRPAGCLNAHDPRGLDIPY